MMATSTVDDCHHTSLFVLIIYDFMVVTGRFFEVVPLGAGLRVAKLAQSQCFFEQVYKGCWVKSIRKLFNSRFIHDKVFCSSTFAGEPSRRVDGKQG